MDCRYPRRPEEGIRSLGSGAVDGGCEAMDVGAGNEMWILCRNSQYFQQAPACFVSEGFVTTL